MCGEEAQKGGCTIPELPDLLEQARGADLPVVGLMCVPPLGIEPAPFFALLDKLARDNGLEERSMGMSGGFRDRDHAGSYACAGGIGAVWCERAG